jgi:hypothetical protein
MCQLITTRAGVPPFRLGNIRDSLDCKRTCCSPAMVPVPWVDAS